MHPRFCKFNLHFEAFNVMVFMHLCKTTVSITAAGCVITGKARGIASLYLRTSKRGWANRLEYPPKHGGSIPVLALYFNLARPPKIRGAIFMQKNIQAAQDRSNEKYDEGRGQIWIMCKYMENKEGKK
jgi:hypothetical protein